MDHPRDLELVRPTILCCHRLTLRTPQGVREGAGAHKQASGETKGAGIGRLLPRYLVHCDLLETLSQSSPHL
jgi:hypothetical protein